MQIATYILHTVTLNETCLKTVLCLVREMRKTRF